MLPTTVRMGRGISKDDKAAGLRCDSKAAVNQIHMKYHKAIDRVSPRKHSTIQMMPSLRVKQGLRTKGKRMNRFMQKGFPKAVLLEIGLYLCTDRFKIALNYMRVCKTIYSQCNESPRFWYFMFVQRFPIEFLKDFYIQLLGQTSSMPVKGYSPDKAREYLVTKIDQLWDFEPEIRLVSWKEMFLQRSRELSHELKTKNLRQFRQVFVDSWKKQNIQKVVQKLELSF